jgi:hypothetical protein
LVYVLEVVVPMEYSVPSLRIFAFRYMDDTSVVRERLARMVKLEEDRFVAGFHQHVQKEREKAYHDINIKKKEFKQGDMVLVYDNKFIKYPRKFITHWLKPYEVAYVKKGGVAQFKTLKGEWKEGLVNGIRLKVYYEN